MHLDPGGRFTVRACHCALQSERLQLFEGDEIISNEGIARIYRGAVYIGALLIKYKVGASNGRNLASLLDNHNMSAAAPGISASRFHEKGTGTVGSRHRSTGPN